MALRQGMRTEMHGGVEEVAPSAASTRVRFAPGASDIASDAGRMAPALTAVRERNPDARCLALVPETTSFVRSWPRASGLFGTCRREIF